MLRTLSPDVILCGWLGSKHQLTCSLHSGSSTSWRQTGNILLTRWVWYFMSVIRQHSPDTKARFFFTAVNELSDALLIQWAWHFVTADRERLPDTMGLALCDSSQGTQWRPLDTVGLTLCDDRQGTSSRHSGSDTLWRQSRNSVTPS